MSNIAHALVRRAVDVTKQHYANGANGGDEQEIKMLAFWGLALLWITVLLYMSIVSVISYTYGNVVATLTMIETPTATAYSSAPESDSPEADAPLLSEEQKLEKQRLQSLEPDLYLVKQAPITAKLSTATKHLKAMAGPLSPFRGLYIAIIYHGLHSTIVNFVCGPILSFGLFSLTRVFVSIITTIVLCRLHMTWTHTVISMPSTKRWWRRFPSLKAGKNIILPTAVWATAQQVCMYVPTVLLVNLADTYPEMYGGSPTTTRKIGLLQLFCIPLIFIATIVLIVIPAHVTLKRVQASMLPEEDDAIVPFDRTFAGKVQPEILGGTGAVSMLDAWKTFDKAARIRLIKLYGKVMALHFTTTVMFTMIIIGELRLIMGGDFEKMVKAIREHVSGQY
ncbi:MAG: hypothetical protein Q9163_002321 [Psora crenata]